MSFQQGSAYDLGGGGLVGNKSPAEIRGEFATKMGGLAGSIAGMFGNRKTAGADRNKKMSGGGVFSRAGRMAGAFRGRRMAR